MDKNPHLANTGLILVDIQNDFLPPNGSLAVPNGTDILPCVQALLKEINWGIIVASADWHPPGHISFASAHNKRTFEIHEVDAPHEAGKITQWMWPDHCVQESHGAAFEASLQDRLTALESDGAKVAIIRKGGDLGVDSYSAFADNVYAKFTSLPKTLHQNSIERVVIVGLAADWCVRFTAIDATKFGFNTILITDGTRAVSPEESSKVFDELRSRGVRILTLEQFREVVKAEGDAL